MRRVALVDGALREPPAGFDAVAHVSTSLACVPWAWEVEVLLDLPLDQARARLPPTLAELVAGSPGTLLRMQVSSLDWMAACSPGSTATSRSDHLQTRDGDPRPVLECWTTLAAVARETSRVRLGQIVTCALYRNAGLLGQMAATVDAASGGRVVPGVGAGWDEMEYRAFGYGETYPTVAARLRNLEEMLRAVRRLFAGPILVGGAGERVLLRLVAGHADACNLTDSFDPAFYRHKLDVLRRHCEDVGRDYEAILRTASFTVSSDVPRGLFETLSAEGISYFILYVDPPGDLAALEQLAAHVLKAS